MNNELNALKTLTEANDMPPLIAWKTIDKRKLAYEGRYYPAGIEIQVLNFGIDEVRYFSGIDETNPSEVTVAMQYLTSRCIRLYHVESGKYYDGTHIFEHDRFNLILHARAVSNLGDPLYTNTKCAKCLHKQKSSIVPETLKYTDVTFADKFNGEVFVLSNKSIEAHYAPLTIHESTNLLDFCQKQLKSGTSSQELSTFTKIAPFLRKDNLDFDIAKLYDSYLSLSAKQLSILVSASEKAIRAIGRIKTSCTNCGRSDETDIEFPSGIKSIVVVEADVDEVLI